MTCPPEYSLETLREDEEFILYRRRPGHSPSVSVLVLVPSLARPAVGTLRKLEHEFSLKSELDSLWAVRPLALSRYKDRRVLLLEDPGGTPLNRVIQGPMETGQFLRLAINLANGVSKLHTRELIHKDLKTSNLLVNLATGQVWLAGFGIASRLPPERRAAGPPEFIIGTLPYMAPEQTGRTNRSIDSRTDLYSLGVVLYEMATGCLPFSASDAMGWVHCHIAKQPVPPDERVPHIPSSISQTIMKLLAKTAEERFQTAAGVESDLRRCLADWKTLSSLSKSPLGQRDALDELVIPTLIPRSNESHRFVHDHIQEAAYSLIPEESRADTDLRIGKSLAQQTPPEMLEDRIFEIVDQLNSGSHLITSTEEREHIAELNLIAGRRAKSWTAYASALKYLAVGRSLLTEETWDRAYELIFSIEYLMAECELLTASMVACENRLSMLAQRATKDHDLAIVTRLRLRLHATLDQSDRGVDVFLEYLRGVGTTWPARPAWDQVLQEYDRIWSLIGSRQIEDLVDLPVLTNPDILDLLDVFTEAVTPSLFVDENLSSLVICRMVNLSLEHGNCDASCFAYVSFAMIAGPRFTNYKEGFRIGRLGYELVEKRGLKRYQARTSTSFGNSVIPWAKHALDGRDLVRCAFYAAYGTGDLTFAAHSWNELITNFLAVGDPLAEVQVEAENGLSFARRARFGLAVDLMTVQVRIIRMLRGLTPQFGFFNEEDFDELRFEQHLANNPVLGLPEFCYWVRKTQARFFAGEYASAVDATLNAQRLLWTSPSRFETAEFRFYGALSHAAVWDFASADQNRRHFDALAVHHRQLEIWAERCPQNFEDRAALVGAEIARIEGRVLDAEQLYEQAIRSARANGFVHNEALANEVAARFYAARGLKKIAYAYLQDARYGYLRWGAIAKVRQLDERYPRLAEEGPAGDCVIGAPVEQLDLATVIKVSRAMSSEIVPDRLIDTLMRTAIEHAAADRGLLILPEDDEQRTEAEAAISGGAIVVRRGKEAVGGWPRSIIHFVERRRKPVIVDDASADNPFSSDTYIRERRVRSILCLPLINCGKVIGVLYLENTLTPDVFTPKRIAVLKLLASLAAISLEHARFCANLEKRETRIQRLADANVMGMFTCDFEGKIIEANDAFLRMLGYSREDPASGCMRWTDLTPEEWHALDERAIAELKEVGTAQPFEKEFFRKGGGRVPVLVGGALFEEGGQEGVAFVLDLSEQKRAEEALRRSEAYLAEAQKLSHTGSWYWNVTTGAIIYSQELFVIYGLDSQEVKPSYESFLERIHPEDRHAVEEVRRAAIREERDYELEYRLLLPGDLIKYVRSLGHFLGSSSGHIEYIGALMDVTEEKRAEQERERLHRAQAELAHINRVSTMGELAASLAHEIKQPIAAAITNAKTCLRWLARGQPDLGEAREAASRLISDVTRASEIISRIGLLFKKSSLQRETVNVNQLIEEMIVLLRSEASRYSISIHRDLVGDLPEMMADRVQLQQVLLNLMLNGIEAMKATGTPGRLTIESRAHENRQIIISVKDTGVGLQPEEAMRIFDAFFTTKPQGTGMGLPISRSIVEAHGGKLWVDESESGSGTTLRFTLPMEVSAHRTA